MRDYVRASGDTAFANDFWPSMRKAYDFCVSTDEDGDGRVRTIKVAVPDGPGEWVDCTLAVKMDPKARQTNSHSGKETL